MKTIKIFLVLLLMTTAVAKAQFTRAELQVSGLNCALCAKATQKSLSALPFVSEIKTDLMRNVFIIMFKNGEQVNFDEITRSMHDAGFFVDNFKAMINLDKVKIAGNQFNSGTDTYQLMNTPAKTLAGEATLTIVDKGFAPRSVSRKYLGQIAETSSGSGRVYHVTI